MHDSPGHCLCCSLSIKITMQDTKKYHHWINPMFSQCNSKKYSPHSHRKGLSEGFHCGNSCCPESLLQQYAQQTKHKLTILSLMLFRGALEVSMRAEAFQHPMNSFLKSSRTEWLRVLPLHHVGNRPQKNTSTM